MSITIGEIPCDIDAEESVLGAMMIRSQAINDVSSILRTEDFYREQHRIIFDAIMGMDVDGKPVDPLLVGKELKRTGQLEAVGDMAYLLLLHDSCPNPYNVVYYAQSVRECAIRRKLIEVGHNIASKSQNLVTDLSDLIATVESDVFSIGGDLRREVAVPIGGIASRSYEMFLERKRSGIAEGLPTGFAELDKLIHGLQNSNLIIVGGRTSMGKTSFALNIVQHVAVDLGEPVLIFSLEMSRLELTDRILCGLAEVDSYNYRLGHMTSFEQERIVMALEKLKKAPILIDDEGDRSMAEIRSIARRRVLSDNIKLIVVDYIQLLYGDQSDRRAESRAQEIARIARSLKAMATELNLPVIAVSQLRRMPATATRLEPKMEDLKESGGIEQNADMVILLYRPEVDDPRRSELRGIADVNLAKNRNGRTGQFRLFWIGQCARFVDWDDGMS